MESVGSKWVGAFDLKHSSAFAEIFTVAMASFTCLRRGIYCLARGNIHLLTVRITVRVCLDVWYKIGMAATLGCFCVQLLFKAAIIKRCDGLTCYAER